MRKIFRVAACSPNVESQELSLRFGHSRPKKEIRNDVLPHLQGADIMVAMRVVWFMSTLDLDSGVWGIDVTHWRKTTALCITNGVYNFQTRPLRLVRGQKALKSNVHKPWGFLTSGLSGLPGKTIHRGRTIGERFGNLREVV